MTNNTKSKKLPGLVIMTSVSTRERECLSSSRWLLPTRFNMKVRLSLLGLIHMRLQHNGSL